MSKMILVYQPGDEISHIIKHPTDTVALCKRTCWPGFWCGILKPERKIARTFPICVDCIRKTRR